MHTALSLHTKSVADPIVCRAPPLLSLSTRNPACQRALAITLARFFPSAKKLDGIMQKVQIIGFHGARSQSAERASKVHAAHPQSARRRPKRISQAEKKADQRSGRTLPR